MRSEERWQTTYSSKSAEKLSWYQPHLERSLAFIRSCGLPPDARIVDVGGGAATLVDDLLAEGYVRLAVVDLAEAALRTAKERLGERASSVEWIVGDATTELLPARSVAFWHDRAVFHFLNEAAAVAAYLAQVRRAVEPGGYVMVATFGLDGPSTCSGMPVTRYDAVGIHAAFGDGFVKVADATEQHETPWGTTQSFVYCLCRRIG